MDRWQRITDLWRQSVGLCCPVCRQDLQPGHRSLVCENRHCFDIAKQGYVDLSAGRGADGGQYDKILWQARGEVCRGGFFAPLTEAVRQFLPSAGGLHIDAGCGEGSLTATLAREQDARSGNVWLGLDLSRDGVRMAAATHPRHLWMVADLARLPLSDHRAAVIVNILSPAAYGEFRRVLEIGGTLIKVCPLPDHLWELRRLWQLPLPETTGETIFRKHFPIHQRTIVRHTINAGALLPALAAMTPLTGGNTGVSLPPDMEVTLSCVVLAAINN